jgi:hypothetical protein
MDTLSMGIFYVVPGCVLWIFGREPEGTFYRKGKGTGLY